MALAASFLQSSSSTSNASAYTFSSQNLGTAAADRKILVVAYGGDSAATFSVSTLTVNGVSATLVAANGLNATHEVNNTRIEFWIASVPTGTSGDIVITWSEAIEQCAYAAYRFTDVNNTPWFVSIETSAIGTMGSDEDDGGPVPPNSYLVTALAARFGTTNVDITWNANATEDADIYVNEGSGNDGNYGAAHYDRTGDTTQDSTFSVGGSISGAGSNGLRVTACFVATDITGNIRQVNQSYKDAETSANIVMTFQTTSGEPQVLEDDVVFVFHAKGGGVPSTISGYTRAADNDNIAIDYKVMGASPDTNVTIVNGGSDVIAALAFVLRGVDTTTPLDATPTENSAAGDPNNPSITTVTNNALVVPFAIADVASNIDPPSGYDKGGLDDEQASGTDPLTASIMIARLVKTTAGAEDPGIWPSYGGFGTFSDTITLAIRPFSPAVATVAQWVVGGGFSRIVGC